jgi:hypothetical protein
MNDRSPVDEVVAILAAGGDVDVEDLQRILGACVKAYSSVLEAERAHVPPYPADGGVTPTDAIRTAAGLLRESDVSSFELAMMFNV